MLQEEWSRRAHSSWRFIEHLRNTKRIHVNQGKPGVENIDLEVFSGFLNCGNFSVWDGITEIVVWYVILAAFSNEKTWFGRQGVNMILKLHGGQISLPVSNYRNIAYFIPQRQGVGSICGMRDNSFKFVLRDTRNYFREAKRFVIH